MRQDLDNLKRDIERQLHDGAYIVFHARSRFTEDAAPILWDTTLRPNPAEFLETALSVGVKLIVYHYREFGPQTIEEAFEKLEAAGLPRERHREIDRELKRLKGYEGFTSAIELSFDFDGRTYLFELTAPWYDEYLDLLDDLDDSIEMNEEPPPMGGGYFSQN
jgi:hypothetical protein